MQRVPQSIAQTRGVQCASVADIAERNLIHVRPTQGHDLRHRQDRQDLAIHGERGDKWQLAQPAHQRVLAQDITRIADAEGYVRNMQAKALREHRSGMIGMIIPLHDNRFFSSISQVFEREARARNLWPIVVSTLRDPEMEVATARTLISYRVELLLITGATDPDAVGAVCRASLVRHINIDLPGSLAPSVISDNRLGAFELTEAVLNDLRDRGKHQPLVNFIGGVPGDNSTQTRISGFRQALQQRGLGVSDDQIDTCGYEPENAEAAVGALYKQLGRLPDGLIVNSTIAFEGVVRFLRTLPRDKVHSCVFGCYDWDPFAALFEFRLTMVRQDVDAMVSRAFVLLEKGSTNSGSIELIKPHLVLPMSQLGA